MDALARLEMATHVLLAAIQELAQRRQSDGEVAARVNQGRDETGAGTLTQFKGLECVQQRGIAALVYRCRGKNHGAAANRSLSGLVPEDKTIAAHRQQRPRDPDLTERGLSRRDVILVRPDARTERNHFPQPLRGPDIQTHPLVRLEAGWGGRPHFNTGIESVTGERNGWIHNHVSPLERDAGRSGEVQGNALSPHRDLCRLVVDFDAANPQQVIAGQTPDRVAGTHSPAHRGARHDHTVAGRDKHAIDGQPEVAIRRLPAIPLERVADRTLQRGETRTRDG